MKSTIWATTAASLSVLALTACGASGTAASGADDGTVQIGLVQQARADVEPWSASWAQSAKKAAAEHSTWKFTETYDAADPTAAEPVMRQLLDGGADVLVMSSFLLADVADKLAVEYPTVPMLITSFGEPPQKNLWHGTSSYLEIGYATCWFLTKLSDDGRMGVMAALDDPPQKEVQEGCALGAKAASPDAEIVTLNTNSYTDQQASREQTQKLLSEGVEEIFFVSGSRETLGGFNLCEQAKAHCATWGGDARTWAKTAGVMSINMDWSVVIEQLVEQADSGNIQSKVFDATFGNGGLIAQPFEGDAAQDVPDGLRTEFAAVLAGLADESIKLPDSSAHPGLR